MTLDAQQHLLVTCAVATGVLLATLAAPATASAKARAGGVRHAAFDAQTRARLDAMRAAHHVPGAAIARIDLGRGLVEEAYLGLRDVRGGKPVTATTLFQAASLGKPLFASAVMQLAASSVIGLDVPLQRYLDSYVHQQQPWKSDGAAATDVVGAGVLDRVTARMVLQHTTGLPNWARSGPLKPEFTPGARWSYSGEGYVLLQRALERCTRETLQTFMTRLVFAPLGMKTATYVRPTADDELSAGYDRKGEPVEVDRWPQPLAPSSLFATLRDYASFVRSLGDRGDDWWRTVAQRAVDVEPSLGLQWGLGWAIEHFDGRTFFFHWGSNPGFAGFVIVAPDRRQAILLLTNGEGGLDLANDVVALWWHARHPLFSFRMLRPDE